MSSQSRAHELRFPRHGTVGRRPGCRTHATDCVLTKCPNSIVGLRAWNACGRAADREWSRAYRAGRAEASVRPFLLSSEKSLEGEVERCRRGELGSFSVAIRDLAGDALSADEVDASFYRAGLYERFADATRVRFPSPTCFVAAPLCSFNCPGRALGRKHTSNSFCLRPDAVSLGQGLSEKGWYSLLAHLGFLPSISSYSRMHRQLTKEQVTHSSGMGGRGGKGKRAKRENELTKEQ
jgi:hypothetical protein